MIRRLFFVVVAALLGAALSACVSTDSRDYGALAVGVGQVLNTDKNNAVVASAGEKLDRYCGGLRILAASATLFAPEKYQVAARKAQAGVDELCTETPRNTRQAAEKAVAIYAEVVAIRGAP